MAGRRSRLESTEFCETVAEAYVSGLNYTQMSEVLECSKGQLRVWVQDPRVQAFIVKMSRDRVARITRKIDSEIDRRLIHVSDWKTDDIIKVRKEYLDRARTADTGDTGSDNASTINELSEAMDANPDLAAALRQLVGD